MTAPDNTCYSPSVFVDSVPVSFTPGGGDQTVTIPLNSAALGWPGASASAGPVTGIDSGSATCSVVGGNLVCNYVDGQDCPPGNVTGGQCEGAVYDFQFTYTEGGVPVLQSRNANQLGPISYENYEVVTVQTGPFGQFTYYELRYGSALLRGSFDVIVAGEFNWFLSSDGNVGYEGDGNCGDAPGPCGDNGNGTVQVTYNGCFPPSEPESDPPTEPATAPTEPSSSSPPSAPSGGGREGGGGGGGITKPPSRRVTGQNIWERTVASNSLPVNADIPWYPVYGSSPNDSTDFRFFLPPLFVFRYGASPSLLPWNGIAVYSDPHGGSLEVGNVYRSDYMTPRITMASLTRLKRIHGISAVANGFTEVVTPLDSTDENEWGDVRYRSLINSTITEPHRTSETNYDGFRSETGTSSYVLRETLKDVDASPQAMWWSSDEGVWQLEGFQVHANNKGERNNRMFGGF